MAERILIVDDSALMRKRLNEIITAAGYETATARNGVDCLRQLSEFKPAAITMDIHMPEMNGLECLARIMDEAPTPVLMVSSVTSESAPATLEAFELGAVDVVQKPGGTISLNIEEVEKELLAKLGAAVKARTPSGKVARRRTKSAPPQKRRAWRERKAEAQQDFPVVLIGVSTGGPRVVEALIADLDPDFPAAVVIAQHMPGAFTQTFARRLDSASPLGVAELTSRRPLAPGVFVCRGDADAVLIERNGAISAQSVPSDKAFPWHPSVERLVRSAIDVLPAKRLVGVMLTGMGDDGANAMSEIKRRGGHTIAESQDTALVYGMPRALIEADGASETLPCDEIGERLNDIVHKMTSGKGD